MQTTTEGIRAASRTRQEAFTELIERASLSALQESGESGSIISSAAQGDPLSWELPFVHYYERLLVPEPVFLPVAFADTYNMQLSISISFLYDRAAHVRDIKSSTHVLRSFVCVTVG
jgi:hypothetical protein